MLSKRWLSYLVKGLGSLLKSTSHGAICALHYQKSCVCWNRKWPPVLFVACYQFTVDNIGISFADTDILAQPWQRRLFELPTKFVEDHCDCLNLYFHQYNWLFVTPDRKHFWLSSAQPKNWFCFVAVGQTRFDKLSFTQPATMPQSRIPSNLVFVWLNKVWRVELWPTAKCIDENNKSQLDWNVLLTSRTKP